MNSRKHFANGSAMSTGIVLSICLSMVSGCSTSGTLNNSRVGWVTVGTKEKPRTLDPSDAYELSSLGIVANMGERLYTYNPGSTQLVPQLATELPKISADGLTYTIPIRQGVVFHDGTPFDAEAMAFSLRRFVVNGGGPSFLLSDRIDYLRPDPDPKSKNPPTINPDGIKATGQYELTIKLKKPFAAFSSLLAFPGACAISPKAYAAHVAKPGPKDSKEKDEGKYKTDLFVGTGPYKMLPRISDDRIELEAFDRYWGKKPANKGVTLQIYLGSASNLYNSFKTGAVDVAYLSLEPDQIRSLQENQKARGWKVTEVEGNGTSYMMLNATQKPLDNPLVRQALAAMLDRPLLNQRVLYNQGKPLYSMIPSSFSESRADFQSAYSNPNGTADLNKAKALLRQAGFTAQKPATIQIWYSSSSTSKKMIANFLRAYAKSKMEGLIVFEPNTAEKTAFSAMSKSRAFPIIIQDWYPDFIDVDTYIQPFLECTKAIQPTAKDPNPPIGCQEGGSAEQGSFYYNDAMNQLISKQGQARDPAARLPLLLEIQKQVVRDVPLIPLWQTKDFIFSRPGVSGAVTDPLQNLQYSTIQKSSK